MSKPREILLIDDNPADAELVRICLVSGPNVVNLHVAEDGAEALRFLQREGEHANAPRPDLVLLDLSLPRIDGRKILQMIRNTADLHRLPVVVFTSSENPVDVAASYDLGASCFVTKPITLNELERVVHAITDFWLTVATLPA